MRLLFVPLFLLFLLLFVHVVLRQLLSMIIRLMRAILRNGDGGIVLRRSISNLNPRSRNMCSLLCGRLIYGTWWIVP